MLSTADKAGSAHLISAADIVSRLPIGHEPREWLEILADEQLAAGGWRFPARWLRDYLSAASASALDSINRDVYVQPNVVRLPDEAVLDAGSALGDPDGHVLLSGIAGSGKSTVLRMRVVDLAEQWLSGGVPAEVPVRVQAAALTRPGTLGEQIAAAVGLDVSRYLTHALRRDVFATEPMTGVRWLVMVDGLDEITDARRRSMVLDVLRHHQNGLYRFVVAARPLSTEDLSWSGWRRYRLMELTPAQLTHMARKWLAASGLPDTIVPALITLGRRDKGESATTPMWATMLCRLFIDRPDTEPPTGVNGLYREFVDLLRARQYTATDEPVASQIHAALRPYGTTAAVAAEELPGRIDELLPSVAATVLADSSTNTFRMIADGCAHLRPHQMPLAAWHALISDIVRRNGLLTEQAGDFVFVHQTIAEFLAAPHIAADPRRGQNEFRRIFGSVRKPQIPVLRGDRETFLIAIWARANRDLAAVLARIVSRHGVQGCVFIAELVAEGVDVPAEIRQATSRELLVSQHREPRERMRVAWARAVLGDLSGVTDLSSLISDRTIAAGLRVMAVLLLLELPGEHEGPALLAELTDDPDLDDDDRLTVLETLGALGDPRGIEGLYAFAMDRSEYTYLRVRATVAFGDLGGSGYDQLLARMAAEGHVNNIDRMTMLYRLSTINRPRYVTALAAVAGNPEIKAVERSWAADLLAMEGGAQHVDTMAAMAADPSYPMELRIRAAEEVVELDDARGTRALALLESYPPELMADTWVGAATLGELRDPHGLDMLAASLSTSVDLDESLMVAGLLCGFGDARGADYMAVVAGDKTLAADQRLAAAVSVGVQDSSRGADLLADLVADPDIEIMSRLSASSALRRANDPRYADLLTVIGEDAAVHGDVRVWTAAALGRLGDPRGPSQLTALADNADLAHDIRVRAAIALAQFAEPQAADLLAGLASESLDDERTPDSRIAAANALHRTGDPRTATVLAALLADAELDAESRIRVAGALGRLRDTRGTDFLAAFAADPEELPGLRESAVRKLKSLGDPRGTALERLLPE